MLEVSYFPRPLEKEPKPFLMLLVKPVGKPAEISLHDLLADSKLP